MGQERGMGQDNRHGRSSVPDSLPPELDDIDSSWDDDLALDASARIPVADPAPGLELDRVTAVPIIPSEQYAAELMAEVEDGDVPDGASERARSDSDPELEFRDEPDSGLRHRDDELKPPDEARYALIPEEPELPVELPPDDPPALSLGLSEPGGADTASVPPLFDNAEAPTAAPRHRMQQRPSSEFDDLSLDLSDPTRRTLEPAEGGRAPAVPSLELEMGDVPPRAETGSAVSDMKDRYAMGDFTGALVIAESILEKDAEDPEARRYVESCREVLTQMYAARLGQLDQRVIVAIPPDQIRWLSLDHRAGFLLSLIDGSSSIEEILDVSGMSHLDALRILYNLLEQRVIALEPA